MSRLRSLVRVLHELGEDTDDIIEELYTKECNNLLRALRRRFKHVYFNKKSDRVEVKGLLDSTLVKRQLEAEIDYSDCAYDEQKILLRELDIRNLLYLCWIDHKNGLFYAIIKTLWQYE